VFYHVTQNPNRNPNKQCDRQVLVSLTNPRNTLHHGNMLQRKVDAQCDKLAPELS